MEKVLEKSGKSQGILSVRKSGNPACEKHIMIGDLGVVSINVVFVF